MAKKAPVRPARTYNSEVRSAQAVETRRRIRAAAEDLFLTKGYVGTSMDAIAKSAGVSRQTVFTAFGSKAGILKELGDVGVVGDDLPIPLAEREAVKRLEDETDAVALIRAWVTIGAGIMERTAPVYRLLVEASTQDPEARELRESIDGLHLGGLRSLVDLLASKGMLRSGRRRPRASEAAWLVGSYASFDAAMAKGWSIREWERWYGDCLVALLSDPGSTSGQP